MLVDLGQGMSDITNSGSSANDADNTITIDFSVAVIDVGPPSLVAGDKVWLAASAGYYNVEEVWSGAVAVTIADGTDTVIKYYRINYQ